MGTLWITLLHNSVDNSSKNHNLGLMYKIKTYSLTNLASRYKSSMVTQNGFATQTNSIKTRNRMAAVPWRRVFCKLAVSHPNPFNYDDLQELTKHHNISIMRDSLRAKMRGYNKSGYVKRVERGTFIIAPKGIKFFDILSSKGS